MKKYLLKERHITLDDTWDVIVVGGGPAGCTAAASSAREGARTLLVEATGALGGMGTMGLVPAWCPFTDGEKIIYRGMAERVFNECKKGMAHVPDESIHGWLPLDPERLKRVYDNLVIDSGAHVLFNTRLSAVEMKEEGIVEALILSNKHGLSAYKAKVYVDCTGDGDLAAWAGAEYEQGDGQKNHVQASTLCFMLSNVDSYAYLYGVPMYCGYEKSPIYAILESGKYPEILDNHLTCNFVGPGTIGFNAGHLFNVDGTDPFSLSKALIQGRRIAAQFHDALAEFHPKAFSDSYLAATASLMGIRESRRIIGDYILTAKDYMERKSFADEICRNSYNIDLHVGDEGIARTIKSWKDFLEYKDNTFKLAGKRYAKGESHGIPYRCLTPVKLKNVLTAGRNISCDRIAHSSIRVMPVCLAMGEAAGMAAAHAAKMSVCDVHSIDVDYLRRRLREEGCFLP